MTYQRLIIGDSSVSRFWQASQIARPQLLGVLLKPVSCLDTLSSALDSISDELDYAIVSVMTSLLIEECSDDADGAKGVLEAIVRRVRTAAERSQRVEVRSSVNLQFFGVFRTRFSVIIVRCFMSFTHLMSHVNLVTVLTFGFLLGCLLSVRLLLLYVHLFNCCLAY